MHYYYLLNLSWRNKRGALLSFVHFRIVGKCCQWAMESKNGSKAPSFGYTYDFIKEIRQKGLRLL